MYKPARQAGELMSRQDIHAILLDNYLLLTRTEEHGRHVIISRVSCPPFLTPCPAQLGRHSLH